MTMLNLTPFFSPEWFTDDFIKGFGDSCYILTQCGIYFSTAPFLQFAFNTLLSIYCSFPVKNLLQKQISLLSALGYGFFGTITQTMMTAMIKPSDSHSDSKDLILLHLHLLLLIQDFLTQNPNLLTTNKILNRNFLV